MKKILSLVLSMLLILSLLAGCGTTEDKESGKKEGEQQKQEEQQEVSMEEDIKDSYYIYAFTPEGWSDAMTYYFHFYDEIPGIGQVFYAGMAMNQVNFSRTYELLEEPFAYECYEERGSEEAVKGEAEYTVVFYDFDGNEIDRCGIDKDILYNDSEIVATGGGPTMYKRDRDGKDSKYIETYEAERPQTVSEFEAVDEETSRVYLYHNGTYSDMVNLEIEGTWALEQLEDGSKRYTLTPESESDTGAVLEVSADQSSAVYRPVEGAEINMYSVTEE